MRLTVVRGGGLAGMVVCTELDGAALAPEVAAELRVLAERAGLVEGAPDAPAAPSHPDEERYEVRCEDGAMTRSLCVTETTMPEPVRELLRWAEARPERTETLGPPGA
jgi:hypothetical protein